MPENRKRKYKKLQILYRGPRARYDYTLLFVVCCLMVFGLIMLYSVTNYRDLMVSGNSFTTVNKQLVFMVIGIVVMLLLPLFDYHLFVRLAPILLILVAALCAYTMFFGVAINGQRRWISIAGVQFQASELAKPVMILALARVLTTYFRPKKRNSGNAQPKMVIMGLVVTGIATAFVVKNNLSTGIILILIGYAMIYIASRSKWLYPAAFVIGVLALVVAWKVGIIESVLNGNRLLRIKAWLEPEEYSKSGYQILQSLYAVASGGMTGKGLGTSIQKLGFLPEAENDMIFGIICEELGYIGAVFTMLLFGITLYCIHKVAERAKDMCGFLIVSGVFVHIMIQTIFNMCVAANFMPNTGVTLPFVSYGGTAIVCTLGEIGLVMSVHCQSPSEIDLENKQE